MKLGMRVLAGCLAVAAAGAVTFAPPPPAGHAGTCLRAVHIDPQESAGEGAGGLVFVVRSTGCAAAGSVGYTVAAGTAQAGGDFVPVSGTLHWTTGDTGPRSIAVPVVSDLVREVDLEDLTVRLTAPSPDIRVTDADGNGRIIDDDSGRPVWAIDDADCPSLTPNQWCRCPVAQPMPETIDCVVVELHLSLPQAGSTGARWATVDGTARAGVDFVGVVDRAHTVPAGATVAELQIELLPRPVGTPTRWFYVRVSTVSAGTVADAIAVVTLAGS